MKPFCAAFLWIATVTGAAAACAPDQVDIRGDFGQARFTVEVADTQETITLGLMNRPSMAMSAGMIFVYPAPRRATFWMRNTLIPLDMLFMGPDGVIEKVHANAVPLDETVIYGGDEIQYVLEINGGLADRLGIKPGAELRHPAIDPERAAWPCD